MLYQIAFSTSFVFASLFGQPMDNKICSLKAVICTNERVEYVEEYIETKLDQNCLNGRLGVKIAMCESGLRLDAINVNKNGTKDVGVWEINDIHGLSDNCRYSLECSTDWVINKVKHDGGFYAWTCLKKIKKSL